MAWCDSGAWRQAAHACVVEDGSTDRTWAIITELRIVSGRFGGLKLSRNRGRQTALMAGLLSARGDVVVSGGANLQDNLDTMDAMLHASERGGHRLWRSRRRRERQRQQVRHGAPVLSPATVAESVEVVFDHADFRLLTRRVVKALRHYDKSNLFLRACGIFAGVVRDRLYGALARTL